MTAGDAVTGVVDRLASRHPAVVAGALHLGSTPGSVWAAAGRLRLPDGPEAGERTLFEIGSITKVFTGLLLADAVVRREVALETPLQDLLPASVRVPSRDGSPILLRHLATHTSGLPRSPRSTLADLRIALVQGDDPYADVTTESLHDALGRVRLRRVPGSGRMRYSNFGAALLGEALVAATDMPDYASLVGQRICAPLGLTDTVVGDGRPAVPLATGHGRRNRPVPHWQLAGLAGAGALLSTAADLLTFLRAQLRPDDTPMAEAIKLSQAEHGTRMGLGWLRMPTRSGLVLWHNGGTGGFRSYAGMMPDSGAAAVVLVNNRRSPDLAGFRLLQALTP